MSKSMNPEFSDACFQKFEQRVKEGRSPFPWIHYSFADLFEALVTEVVELGEALKDKNLDEIAGETVDVANCAWFIYQKVKEGRD